jgi:hypothetical protein
MIISDAPLAGAADVLRTDSSVFSAYSELVNVLRRSSAPRHERRKAKPQYVYDQTTFVGSIRDALEAASWTRNVVLAAEAELSGTRVRRVNADMVKSGVHAIFEFGNRSYYAYNVLTRVAFGFASGNILLSVFVLPTQEFANSIDSNVVSFEQVGAEMARLLSGVPQMVPGPMMLIGVAPEVSGQGR